jgi:hypothetical protein
MDALGKFQRPYKNPVGIPDIKEMFEKMRDYK